MNGASNMSKQAIWEDVNPNARNSVFDSTVTYSRKILHGGGFMMSHGVYIYNSKKS